MESSIINDVNKQIEYMHQTITLCNSLKEKCIKLENEKKEAVAKCAELKNKIERLSNEKCNKCAVLMKKLSEERKSKEMLKKEEKAKLLKAIARTLDNIEDRNTNQMTNAQQLFTELVCGNLDDNEAEEKREVTLIADCDQEDVAKSRVLADETLVIAETEDSSNDCHSKPEARIVVSETQAVDNLLPKPSRNVREATDSKNQRLPGLHRELPKSRDFEVTAKETRVSPELDAELQPLHKKLKTSPVLSSRIQTRSSSPNCYCSPKHQTDTSKLNESERSPSVLSELLGTVGGSSNQRSSGRSNSSQEDKDKGTTWKMKPNVLIDGNASGPNGKKLKQMTLSLARPEKKHDISLAQAFNGGVANTKLSDDERDVILPSPEHPNRKFYKKKPCETMEDPDLTLFNPGMTSTCIPPVESSFDRLPQVEKSPPFKYRRDAVRKRAERQRLPGQDCDECARYYEAAGLDRSQDIRTRLNTCSRHRDKFRIRANTPPGFWDPVIPPSPEEENIG